VKINYAKNISILKFDNQFAFPIAINTNMTLYLMLI